MTDALLQEIATRVEALGEIVTPEAVRGMVDSYFQELLNDDEGNSEFLRKMRFGAPEPKLIGSKFARWNLSVGDIEFMHDILTAGQRSGLSKNGPSEELDNAFRAVSEAQYMSEDEVQRIDQRALDGMFPRLPLSWFTGRDRDLAESGRWMETAAYKRAMDTAESGYGSQLVGAQYVGELWQSARFESRIFALLNTFEMTDPTAYLPVEADLPEMIFVSENTANNASNYDTQKTGSNRVQVDAKKMLIHQMWSGEMEEDSIIAYIPFLRRQALMALAHYSDSLVLNGDTTNAATGNINLDDADPADTKHYLAFDGIRHAGLVDNTGNQKDLSNAAIAVADLMDVRGRMLDETYLMDWGHPTIETDLVHIVDPSTGDKIAQLDEIIKQKEVRGRPILQGEVSNIVGNPVISSLAMSKTEADGKVSTTGGNNTRGQVASFNRRGFVAGWRRRVKVETERMPATDQSRIVYSMRMGFGRYQPTGAAASIEAADVIFNINVS